MKKPVESVLLTWPTFIAAHLSQRTIWEKHMKMEVSKYWAESILATSEVAISW
jgi:hypothetical protein